MPPLLDGDSRLRVLLLGHGSERFAASYLRSHPQHESRLIAGGSRASYDLACHLAACDVVMQPYPDGVTSRRTTLMASLALGLPIVTTSGPLTEGLWEKSDAVVLAPVGWENALAEGVQLLLADRARRDEISRKARDLYQRQFSLEHTIQLLRS